MLPHDNTNIARLMKEEIKSAIERVAQFADERSRAIRVQFVAGEVKVFSSSLGDRENRKRVCPVHHGQRPDLEIGFNAQYLAGFPAGSSTGESRVRTERLRKSAGEFSSRLLQTSRSSIDT